MSVVVCGLGQIYNGQLGKGLCMLGGYIVLAFIASMGWLGVFYMFFIPLAVLGPMMSIGAIFGLIGLWIYGVYDAYKTAERINLYGHF